MKITCTKAQQDYLIHLLSLGDKCILISEQCGPDCAECVRRNIDWQIEDDRCGGFVSYDEYRAPTLHHESILTKEQIAQFINLLKERMNRDG